MTLGVLKSVIQAVRRNWCWLKWLVALSLLSYLFYAYRTPIAKLRAQKPDWTALALALLVVAASITVTFYRW